MTVPRIAYETAPWSMDSQRSIHRPFRMYRKAQPATTAPSASAAQRVSEAAGFGKSWPVLQTNTAANKAPMTQPSPNSTLPNRSAMTGRYARPLVNSREAPHAA